MAERCGCWTGPVTRSQRLGVWLSYKVLRRPILASTAISIEARLWPYDERGRCSLRCAGFEPSMPGPSLRP